MASLSKTTSDHEEIQKWAEERGGKPSHVKSTGSKEDIGILRIDFPGYSGQGSLEEITWDQFFEKFDERGLSLIYQEETAAGERSNFNKLVSAETAQESESGGGPKRSGRSGSKKSSAKKSPSNAAKKTSAAAKKSGGAKKAAKKASNSSTGRSLSTKRSGRKAASGRGASKKSAKKTSPAKKGAAKKTASKKTAAKKTPAKKTATKKGAAKKRR